MSRRDIAIRQFIAAGLALFAVLYAVSLLHCGLTPQQAGDATKATCTLVQAFEGDAVVDSICASAPELVQLADAAIQARAASRADSGSARMVTKCRQIPNTGTCATEMEIAIAIQKVKASR